jgi:hypothetical protein
VPPVTGRRTCRFIAEPLQLAENAAAARYRTGLPGVNTQEAERQELGQVGKAVIGRHRSRGKGVRFGHEPDVMSSRLSADSLRIHQEFQLLLRLPFDCDSSGRNGEAVSYVWLASQGGLDGVPVNSPVFHLALDFGHVLGDALLRYVRRITLLL